MNVGHLRYSYPCNAPCNRSGPTYSDFEPYPRHAGPLPASEDIVHIEGGVTGTTMRFSGPRQARDFIAYWCSTDHLLRNLPLKALEPLNKYVATQPGDTRRVMLAVQERHMASKGLDTISVCPQCRKDSPSLQVLSTGANHQRFGNPQRALRAVQYFCGQLAVAPLPP